MRTRSSMGKMVNKLTKREISESYALIDRIARGVNQPYAREFSPKIVASQEIKAISVKPRENAFYMKEQTKDNVVLMRLNKSEKTKELPKIVFPKAFYDYFEVIETPPSKVG